MTYSYAGPPLERVARVACHPSIFGRGWRHPSWNASLDLCLNICLLKIMLKLLSKPKLMSIKILGEAGYRCPHLLLNCATRPEKSLTEALPLVEYLTHQLDLRFIANVSPSSMPIKKNVYSHKLTLLDSMVGFLQSNKNIFQTVHLIGTVRLTSPKLII